MTKIENPFSVGVIVGRFMVPYLHEAHIDLIESVRKIHEQVIVVLGVSPLQSTLNNPLSFLARKDMILEKFPDVTVTYIKDVFDDTLWSENLDKEISVMLTPKQTAVLYGSRDSFIPHYKGKFNTCELKSNSFISGTAIREKAYAKAKNSEDFRAGVIYATGTRYPTVYTTVDVAIFNEAEDQILLGQKTHEKQYRFIGGFADVKDASFEASAKREVSEETGLEISNPVYLGSYRVDDWRYRKEQDKITTLFFKAKKIFGSERAGDDIEKIRWFSLDKLKREDIVYTHQVLFEALNFYLAEEKK